MAGRANLDAGRLSKYETGAHQVPLGSLIKLARAFGVLVDVLLPDSALPCDSADVKLVKKLRALALLDPRDKLAACSALDIVLAIRRCYGADDHVPPERG